MSKGPSTAGQWISALELRPHPEGGYYRELLRSSLDLPREILAETHPGSRSLYTTIYFLLAAGGSSKLHVLRSDEIWFYHHGASITITSIDPDGSVTQRRLGPNPDAHESFQVLIPAGHIFGSSLPEAAEPDYALAGCMVSPGFNFSDFHMPTQTELLRSFPQHRDIILELGKTEA